MTSATTWLTGRRARACIFLDRLIGAAPTETGAVGRFLPVPDADYLLGLLDGLGLQGLLELREDDHGRLEARAVSAQAGWALTIVNDILDTGAPLVGDWQTPGLTPPEGLRHPFGRAGDLLAALDRRRLELLPGAEPARTVAAALALISPAGADGRTLLVEDRPARALQLPGGRIDDADPSPIAALLRELDEELGLTARLASAGQLPRATLPPLEGPGLTARLSHGELTLRPLPSLELVDESATYGLRSRIRFFPFLVTLPPGLDLAGPHTYWASLGELRAGRAADGRAIKAEPLLRLLASNRLDLPALLAGQ